MSEPSSRETRQERLNVLLRKRHGQPKRDALTELIGDSPQPWRFVVPPDSDPVTAALLESVRSNRRDDRLDRRADLDAAGFQRELDEVLEPKPGTAPAVLTISDAKQIGVIETTVDLVRSLGRAILDLDRDSLLVADPEWAWGLVCQRFENAGTSYEIESWPAGGGRAS